MKKLSFTKMHGLGNDFAIVDHLQQDLYLSKEDIIRLADRHRGIGFDQLLLLKPSNQADVYCQIFNADGSEAEQCGNGMRCVARYMYEEKIKSDSRFSIETLAGLVQVEINNYEAIRISMGLPQIQNQHLALQLEQTQLDLTVLSMGNPHAIQKVSSTAKTPVTQWGAEIEKHRAFPQGVNVGFMEIINRQAIRLRTYERGAGETQACGSNTCAAVVAGIQHDWLDRTVQVSTLGGTLQVEWQGEQEPVFLTGPASRVYRGEVELA